MAELPTVIGRYEIVSRLGQGGMGSLYLAKDPKIGRLVAIKLVRQEFDSPEARQRFAREAQSAGTLRHPNIVTIFDVDEYQGLPFIAMEYVDGETLSEIVRRKAPTPMIKRLQWIEELCAGLAYAHRQGVVHRDVKPANLILDNEGALKILDFGLARREASKFTQSQAVIGTPNYMSPEQIRAGDVGPRSDIFAVGAVLYEVLACVEAFPGRVHEAMHKILYEEPKPLNHVLHGVDPAIVAIVNHALDKEPARRYADLTLMRNEIAAVRQRLERQMDSGETVSLMPDVTRQMRPPSGGRHSPPAGSAPGSGHASGGSRRGSSGAHRLTVQKKRAAQIDLHLADARKFCDSGAFDKARESVEQALMFDPDLSSGLQLLDEIGAEEERQQIAALVTAARVELQHGRLGAAEQLVAQASELAPQSPEVLQLREAVDTTRREIERARQVQDMLRRARTRFSEGSFEGAIRAVGELLAIDPDNAAARDLQARAQEAIDSRGHRAERDAAAQAAVTEARALFDKGDKASAIATLEAFMPPHDLVTGFLASLRGEEVADALQEPAPADTGRVSSVLLRPARGVTTVNAPLRTPLYAGLAGAVVIVLAVGTYMMSRGQPDADPPRSAAATQPSTTAAAPVIPPPAVVTPPASLTSQPPQNQSDRDAIAAYRLLASGQHAEASKLVAQIARNDPKNENLKELRDQIKVVADTEKQRAAATVAAPQAAALPAATGNPPPTGAQPSAVVPAVDKPVAPPAGSDGAGAAPTATTPMARPEAAPVPAAGPPPAPPPVAPSRAEVERPLIEASIQEYANALSRRDLKAVSRVRTYTETEARNWQNAFKQFAEYRLIVKPTAPPAVTGDQASVSVEERVATTAKGSGIQLITQPRQTEYRLEKIAGKWMLLPPR